ncbi:MAG: hypothetical protein WB566_15370 [Terriglobales bacterium]
MVHRLSLDTLESLHVTLQKLEQGATAAFEHGDIAALKRAILTRIAELEIRPLEPANITEEKPSLGVHSADNVWLLDVIRR